MPADDTKSARERKFVARTIAPLPGRTYAVSHANFVVADTKDNLAHVIYPGGVRKDDWVHDLPLLITETWLRP
jgi:hypothetical protein